MDKDLLNYTYHDFSRPWEKDKIPLVLIHGLGANLEMWFPQIPDFSKYFPVIAVDLPGCGKSKPLEGKVTIEGIAQALYKTIKTITQEKVNVLGISLGAMVALEYIGKHAEDVSKLVLTSLPYDYPAAIMPLLRQTMAQYEQMTMQEITELRIKNAFGRLATSEMIQYLIDVVLKTPKKVYLDYAASTLYYDFSAHYPSIKAKTLIISGELDQAVNPDQTRKIQSAITDSQSLILNDTGHALSLENPERFNLAVLEFLKD